MSAEPGAREAETDDQRAVALRPEETPDHRAVGLDGRPPRAQRERQQDRRQEQADRQDDVRSTGSRGTGSRASRSIVACLRRHAGRRASSATQSPSTVRAPTTSPAVSNAVADLRLAVAEDPRSEEHATRAQLVAKRGRQRDEDAGDEVGQHDVEGRLAGRQAPLPCAEPPSEARSARRWRASPRWRSGRCPRRARSQRRAAGRRWPGCRSRSRRRGRARRARSPSSASVSTAARHSRVVGWRPVPNAIPGSRARTTSSGWPPMAAPRRADDQPPPDAHDREVGLPRLGPVRLVDDARAKLADGSQPERLKMPERRGHLGHGAIRRRPDHGPGCRHGPSPAGWDRRGRQAPPRRGRKPARRTSRRARPARGSR